MNHAVLFSSGVDSPPGGDSPHHLETLTSNSGSSFQPLSSYPPTTTYYSTPAANYFTNDLPTHHGLQPVRLPSITSSLGGVGDLSTSIIKEHPAAVQADQMNTYMEFFVDGTDGPSGQVVEEVVVDDHHLMDDEHDLLEDDGEEDDVLSDEEELSYSHLAASSSRAQPSLRGKKGGRLHRGDHDIDELLRSSNDLQSPDLQLGMDTKVRSDLTRQRRAQAARSRYQRMSENERKQYNQRRRYKALGLDINGLADPVTANNIKETIKMANAKKAEAARLRYHRMTPGEKKEYNQRRTESFRKRREEEEILLSTPAGCISPEALAKAQQIMVRNARKAESARLRYQRMTPDQRKSFKDYNVRRASSKKTLHKDLDLDLDDEQLVEQSCSGSSVANDSLSDHQASFGLGTSFSSETMGAGSSASFDVVQQQAQAPLAPPPPKDLSEEILEKMAKEVEKKTKQAKMILDRQQRDSHQQQSERQQSYTEQTIHQEQAMMNDPAGQNPPQVMIDEKALHDILMTGRDANGLAVELRTMDGHKITDEAQLSQLAQGQTIVIAPVDAVGMPSASSSSSADGKDGVYLQSADGHSGGPYGMVHPRFREGDYPNPMEQDPNLMSMAQRHQLAKAKRAERARIRYRNMQPELRQAQNARRADLLRKARARDEELVTMGESRDVNSLEPSLQRAIVDAKERRKKRAEQARQKYHRMTSEERRQYNAMRDAQRRQRKRQQEIGGKERMSRSPDPDHDHLDMHHRMSDEPAGSNSISPNNEQLEERIIYNDYMYDDPVHAWEQ